MFKARCDFQPGDLLFEYAGELITGKYSYTFNLDHFPGFLAQFISGSMILAQFGTGSRVTISILIVEHKNTFYFILITLLRSES